MLVENHLQTKVVLQFSFFSLAVKVLTRVCLGRVKIMRWSSFARDLLFNDGINLVVKVRLYFDNEQGRLPQPVIEHLIINYHDLILRRYWLLKANVKVSVLMMLMT